jgi:hypothetical protein
LRRTNSYRAIDHSVTASTIARRRPITSPKRRHCPSVYRNSVSSTDRRIYTGSGRHRHLGQIEELFGEQGSYLIDFYHVCEYLSAASKTIAPDATAGKAWMEAQKEALKTGRADAVLSALAPHRENLDASDDQAPVRVCHRYLGAREAAVLILT